MLHFFQVAVETFDLANMSFTMKDLIFLGAIVASWYSLKERVKVIEVRLKPVYEEWEKGKHDGKARTHHAGGSF